MDNDEVMAGLRAAMDQAREGSKELAGTLGAFYQECVAQGFDEDQAMALTIAFLTSVLGLGTSS